MKIQRTLNLIIIIICFVVSCLTLINFGYIKKFYSFRITDFLQRFRQSSCKFQSSKATKHETIDFLPFLLCSVTTLIHSLFFEVIINHVKFMAARSSWRQIFLLPFPYGISYFSSINLSVLDFLAQIWIKS